MVVFLDILSLLVLMLNAKHSTNGCTLKIAYNVLVTFHKYVLRIRERTSCFYYNAEYNKL